MKFDRYLLRGLIFMVVSLSLAVYEAAFRTTPSYEVIAGYALVFGYGIFSVFTRQKRVEASAAENLENDAL